MARGEKIDPRAAQPADLRFVAQLNMLHSMAATLASLDDVSEIAAAITEELHTILDYHNCRVYVMQDDGWTLLPIAFRGEIFYEYEHETLEELISHVGEGITGWVAEHRTSLLTPDARLVEFAVQIPDTDDILESMLAVPMTVGDTVQGVIVLSSLGFGAFDEEDQRLLEVLASHAAIAISNAKLLQAEREAAETSSTLLGLSKQLTQLRSVGDILQGAIETVSSLIGAAAVAFHVRDEHTGDFRLARLLTVDDSAIRPRHEIADVPESVAVSVVFDHDEPLVLPRESPMMEGADYLVSKEPREMLVAPLRWEPDGAGTIAVIGHRGEGIFGDRELRLIRGVADLTSLALGNARRISELERFHELVAGLDAAFWEASIPDLRFTFVAGAVQDLLGGDTESWQEEARTWGSHIDARDREDAMTALQGAIESGVGEGIEYRVIGDAGAPRWIRDLVHVIRGRGGTPTILRGLMVDVTERKRAERALRASERKYSDAFKREREAAQRLRMLDDMKNTFLEAVSHDLRTPLTSILGSALTLERSNLDLPPADALDMVRRIAANARKLERLLSDLLDLDRLQRGIVSPKRRATDLEEFVGRAVQEMDTQGRSIEVDVQPGNVQIDQAKTERILENLLSNSIRHTPEEARIWVRAQPHDGGVSFVVEDDGPGIPPELREAIFEPFRQAPGSSSGHAPGVGIGLSLVRRFAELHGGNAWAEERDGGGASFHVFLPGAEAGGRRAVGVRGEEGSEPAVGFEPTT
jgi:signal transduction histidine kinase/putative methionine-R-sulfoxide reductase with GAF domain